MTLPGQSFKMVAVDAKLISEVGYAFSSRKLYIRFTSSPTLCYDGVPGFRYQGLLAAPRKDAYYATYIKNSFLAKPVELPPQF